MCHAYGEERHAQRLLDREGDSADGTKIMKKKIKRIVIRNREPIRKACCLLF